MSRLDRQSFLGPDSDAVLEAATIGIVGLGGGGSHVVQQAAHVGIGGYVNVDPQAIEETNTNRLVGGTLADVYCKPTRTGIIKRLVRSLNRLAGGTLAYFDCEPAKTGIAERVIRGLKPQARIISVRNNWQSATDQLKTADVIVGAVDGFTERDELERFARRYLIPYIDVGMDVHDVGDKGFLVSGQVILSTPGAPCLRCCGVITDDRLRQEAKRYGAAGGRPQVVWPNGVLASTAIGLLAQILTPWYQDPPAFVYLEYDGNKGTVSRSAHMDALKGWICPHHPPDETGDPMYDIRKHLQRERRRTPSPGGPTSWWRALWRHIQTSN